MLVLLTGKLVITADGSTVTTMVSGRGYFVNTTSAAGLLKLPLSASRGDYVEIKDYARTFGTNNVTVQRNGHKFDGTDFRFNTKYNWCFSKICL